MDNNATLDRETPVTVKTAEIAAVDLVNQTLEELTPYEAQAQALVIQTDADYESVACTLMDTKARLKALEEKRVDLVNPLNGVVTKINAMFRRPKELLDGVANILNRKLGDYRSIKEEERRKAEALARELAAKEAERIRKEGEAAAKRLEKKGDTEGADAVRASAEAVAVAMPVILPPMASAAPKVSGMATRHNYKARITNLAVLPEQWFIKTPDQKGLDARAAQVKRVGPSGIPGVEFYDDQKSYGTGR